MKTTHQMQLQPEPFDMIRNGVKTIELRLFDEKRKKIKIGDEIVFTNTENGETLAVRVLALSVFDSFEELYKTLPLLQCGYTEKDVATASPDDMDTYYPKEKQKEYGVVGITIALQSAEFQSYYRRKEELVQFCRVNGLPTSGGKQELSDRIACFLDTGAIMPANRKRTEKHEVSDITKDSIIEHGIVCSELHRAFFKREIGDSFSFNVAFQKWLRENSGKTYADAIAAYKELKSAAKGKPKQIDKQFEYNTYIRDFFNDNKGLSLSDAIKCWNYKKSIKGHNKYERSDLKALGSEE